MHVSGRCLRLFLWLHIHWSQGQIFLKQDLKNGLKLCWVFTSALPAVNLQALLRLTMYTYYSWRFKQLCEQWRCWAEPVEEPCRDWLEPRSYSLKPMANVKQIRGDKACKDIHCLFSQVWADCQESPLCRAFPNTACIRSVINKCFHPHCSAYSNRQLNTVLGFAACHPHLSIPVAKNT